MVPNCRHDADSRLRAVAKVGAAKISAGGNVPDTGAGSAGALIGAAERGRGFARGSAGGFGTAILRPRLPALPRRARVSGASTPRARLYKLHRACLVMHGLDVWTGEIPDACSGT